MSSISSLDLSMSPLEKLKCDVRNFDTMNNILFYIIVFLIIMSFIPVVFIKVKENLTNLLGYSSGDTNKVLNDTLYAPFVSESNNMPGNYPHYQSIDLVPQDPQNGDEMSIIQNAQANRLIAKETGIIHFNIYANLNLLNGNIYNFNNKEAPKQAYVAYLSNDTGKKVSLGELFLGDGRQYRLEFTTKDTTLLDYPRLTIEHQIDDQSMPLITGTF